MSYRWQGQGLYPSTRRALGREHKNHNKNEHNNRNKAPRVDRIWLVISLYIGMRRASGIGPMPTSNIHSPNNNMLHSASFETSDHIIS